MSKSAETPETEADTTLETYVVTKSYNTYRKKHRPDPDGDEGEEGPVPACDAWTRKEGDWQTKSHRQCIFYDPCQRPECFGNHQ